MTDFIQWRLAHYSQRLSEELAAGNTKAVRFLRAELHNLKKTADE